MRRTDYDAFTRALAARLRADPRVVGLVAVGSMADRDYGPDEWSDHDFFVVTSPGEQEQLRRDLSWLPSEDEVVLSFRETSHGLKVLYDHGHLLEFAVFGLDELGLARVNRFRVLFDQAGVAERMDEVARASGTRPAAAEAARTAFGMFVTNVLVGAGRARRGEQLSGAQFVKSLSLGWLLELLHSLPAERSGLLDDLDPFRRFDLVHPQLARELEALLTRDTLAAATGLLELAERELRPVLPDLPWHALAVARRRLEAAD